MKSLQDARRKAEAAYKLLEGDSTTYEKFDSVATLLSGLDPRLDRVLVEASKRLSELKKLQEGEVVQLSAEHLPEETEEQKKKKRALLLFLSSFKKLKSEVGRVRGEFETFHTKDTGEKISTLGRIVSFAKGPFGIITFAAAILAGFLVFGKGQKPKVGEKQTIPHQTVKVIEFRGEKIPLSEIAPRTGPDCDAEHYHAKDHVQAKAIDGTTVSDPGGCGFGRISEVAVVEVEMQTR